jgi:exodeoxyribonuclease V alpha subunit
MSALEELRARGVLSELDWHFAEAVARIGGDEQPTVRLAAALASRAVGQGHVCLDLRRLLEGGALADDAGEAVDCAWPPLGEWTAALCKSPLVASADADAVTPLVLDGAGRLYLRRYWEHQTRLAEAIRARAGAEDAEVDGDHLTAGLERLFPRDAASPADAPDGQRRAALVAVRRRFCVISGGPGTGKTHTVVRILALLVEQALHAGRRPPRFTLLAPTGKAAARLTEALRAGARELDCAAEVVAALPEAAATIHRGLGAVPGRSTQYRHGPGNPLLTDVVLVDEASMVDVALMARLVAALPPHARLILLGDQDQLASVEAGAVLGDICNSGGSVAVSPPSGAVEARVSAAGARSAPGRLRRSGRGRDAPLHGAQAETEPRGIEGCIVQLTRSYRYGYDSGIGRLARAINSGDADGVASALAAGGAVARVDPAPGGALGAALEAAVREGFAPYFDAADAVARLRALERFRVLCAHRRGPFGVEPVNAQIEHLLAAAGWIRPDAQFYAGRPILVTRNDYQLQLFNGDVGTIADDAERPGGRVAVFLAPDGTPRRIAPSRLPPHETVFAMSVHKSQGSEFDAVAVLLPEQPSPVVTRELLYTAVTRARQRATVYASAAVVAHAVTHRIARASGLRDALWS